MVFGARAVAGGVGGRAAVFGSGRRASFFAGAGVVVFFALFLGAFFTPRLAIEAAFLDVFFGLPTRFAIFFALARFFGAVPLEVFCTAFLATVLDFFAAMAPS